MLIILTALHDPLLVERGSSIARAPPVVMPFPAWPSQHGPRKTRYSVRIILAARASQHRLICSREERNSSIGPPQGSAISRGPTESKYPNNTNLPMVFGWRQWIRSFCAISITMIRSDWSSNSKWTWVGGMRVEGEASLLGYPPCTVVSRPSWGCLKAS